MTRLYAFDKATARKLKQFAGGLADGSGHLGYPEAGPMLERSIVLTTSQITTRSGTTLGTGTADLYRVESGSLVTRKQTDGTTVVSVTLYNLTDKTVPSGAYLIADRVDGVYMIPADFLYKRLIKFSLSSALTTSDASKSATISAQYGPGVDNPNTGSGAITVYNLYNGTSYVFSGASGKVGYAYWHDANNYYIIQMECA